MVTGKEEEKTKSINTCEPQQMFSQKYIIRHRHSNNNHTGKTKPGPILALTNIPGQPQLQNEGSHFECPLLLSNYIELISS